MFFFIVIIRFKQFTNHITWNRRKTRKRWFRDFITYFISSFLNIFHSEFYNTIAAFVGSEVLEKYDKGTQAEIIETEIKELSLKGYKEIVLTGIHLSSYGKDKKEENISLIDAIKLVASIEGIERVRLGSLEPMIITDEFLRQLKDIKEFKVDDLADAYFMAQWACAEYH